MPFDESRRRFAAAAEAVERGLQRRVVLRSRLLDDLAAARIGDDAHDPRYIVTVRGLGFRFQNDPDGTD